MNVTIYYSKDTIQMRQKNYGIYVSCNDMNFVVCCAINRQALTFSVSYSESNNVYLDVTEENDTGFYGYNTTIKEYELLGGKPIEITSGCVVYQLRGDITIRSYEDDYIITI